MFCAWGLPETYSVRVERKRKGSSGLRIVSARATISAAVWALAMCEARATVAATARPHRLVGLDMAERVHNLEFGRSVRREPGGERRDEGQGDPRRQDERRLSPKLDAERSGLSVRRRRPLQARTVDGEGSQR